LIESDNRKKLTFLYCIYPYFEAVNFCSLS
jgi:hypothetical protein